MRNRISALVAASVAVSLALAVPTDGAEKSAKKKYVPPVGFAGHTWGELRTHFDRLPEAPIGVGAAYILSQEKQTDFTCVPGRPSGPTITGAIEGCDFQATLLRMRKEYEGGGFYVLSEFAIPDQGFRIGDEKDGVLVHPVIYQFCANWSQSVKKKDVPPNFDAINQFCGVRLMFQSETREELAKLPAEYVTVYDRMLDRLLEKFGRPANFLRRGQVIVETEDGDSQNAADRKFSVYRWCPAGDRALHTQCKASVVLTINPTTGQGTVLYSTPLLWEYAFARENNGFKGDRLYRLLHARKEE
jgi:hypothetical protein